MKTVVKQIADELKVNEKQVIAAASLLDEGATVPFVARYRKELTGSLDDTQLRYLEERLGYLRELEARKEAIIKSIDEQAKLTPKLQEEILSAETKTRIEDLYRPYMPKRRTKAQSAKEAGIEPLALTLLENPEQSPEQLAEKYINQELKFNDVKSVLDGARQILMELFSEDADLSGLLREYLWKNAFLESKVAAGKESEGAKFSDYFDSMEALDNIPSHRVLALFRGRTEGFLQLNLVVKQNADEVVPINQSIVCEHMIAKAFAIENKSRAADAWLLDTVRWTLRVKLITRIDTELKLQLKKLAEMEAIKVFANNLKDLLMAAPAGSTTTMGLDPGFRTGVKVAVVDNTGKFIDHATIYPHPPQNQWNQSLHTLTKLIEKHEVKLIAIGNGTASRETDKFAAELIKSLKTSNLTKIVVSEAGASVYSASALAAAEFPDLDVSIRGAVSIARRLQDPLAELVKIEPKAIGVGQYQHDVNQSQLNKSLIGIVEDCVNAVGVDANMASAPLLTHVSGLNKTLAKNIVDYRDQHGAFTNRKQLIKVAKLGKKAFEQAAGFLRISNGENPLDFSAVHPEAYPLAEKIIQDTGKDFQSLIGDVGFLRKLKVANYTDEQFGELTVRDILTELEKPGRDPRPEFKAVAFQEDVEKISDLKPEMILQGVVTNVANFGAFVDIGVHQDGLVHISVLADKFVKDPRDVVRTGDIVKVKVVEVDIERKRISLSMRLAEKVNAMPVVNKSSHKMNKKQKAATEKTTKGESAFALAFANAKK